MSPKNLTLYTARICPFAQRVEIALAEVNAPFTRYEIDLQNKPEWYPKVNPVTKVPAAAYGGPEVPPDQPSPESAKLTESLVLLEFVADLYPSLLPADPVERARARFAIDTISIKIVPTHIGFNMRGDTTAEQVTTAYDAFQSLLPPDGFVVGQYSIADAAIAPFLGRLEAIVRNDAGKFQKEDGEKVYAELFQSPRFARLQKYWQDVSSRESFKTTFAEALIVERSKARFTRA